MKKHLFILGFAMLLSVASAFAQGGTTGPLTWNFNNGTLTISGNGAMPDYVWGGAPWNEYRASMTTAVIESGVTTIGNYAFNYCYVLASITIPNSVTMIGKSAFSNCTALESITIPNSVTTIGDDTFSYCSALKSITIPNGVTTIGYYTFAYCTALKSITISNGATMIENYAFDHCTALESITIPNGVTTIGNYAFFSCTALASITIPNSVTTIGNSAFFSCTALEAITIPNSVTTIGYYAFHYCATLESITIPSSVTTIGKYAFSSCTTLESITVESGNPNYSSINGVLFDKNKTVLICYPIGKKENIYDIPNGVITVRDCAFYKCTALTSITISNSVTTIEEGAFSICTALESITIPNSVTTIGEGAFYNCDALTSITNLNPVPVEIQLSVFASVNKNACTLKVPTSAVSAYQTAEVWKEFKVVGGGICVNPKANNSEYGYATGNELYEANSIATVTAVPRNNYKFVNWTIDGVEVSRDNPYSFTVTEDIELVANFEETVGIVEPDNYPSLRMYPNPTTGLLTICDMRYATSDNRISDVGQSEIVIYDMMGRVVHVETHGRASLQSKTAPPPAPSKGGEFRKSEIGQSPIEIDISHLPQGIYGVSVISDGRVVGNGKVVKQ